MDKMIARPKANHNLTGPLTWILLVVMLLVFVYGIGMMFLDSPAPVLRDYFESCFEGNYEAAWEHIMPDSVYMQQKGGDVQVFSDSWEKSKNHGTEYVGIRIDGVMWNLAGGKAKVLYAIMAYDQQTREKVSGSPEQGLYKVKILQDSYIGSMFMSKDDADGKWKLVESEL